MKTNVGVLLISITSAFLIAEPGAYGEDLKILSPTSSFQASAGSTQAQKFYVEMTKPATGLGVDDFSVTLGTIPAEVVAVYEALTKYILVVLPNSIPTEIVDLTVSVSGQSDTSKKAVRNDFRPTKAVVLVIDRSVSFLDSIGYAMHAASQSLWRLGPGDSVGVVAFDLDSDVVMPLMEIEHPTGAAPIFSDSMEMGGDNWRHLDAFFNAPPEGAVAQFWQLVEGDSFSTTHHWSLMPEGRDPWRDVRLASRTIDLSAATAPWLGFWFRLDKTNPDTTLDYRKTWLVEISTDGGESWQPHPDHLAYGATLGSGHAAERYLQTGYTPGSNFWRWALYDLSSYVDYSEVQVSMVTYRDGRFTTDNDLKIDDVVIVEEDDLNAIDRARGAIFRINVAKLGEGTHIADAVKVAAGMLAPNGAKEKYIVLLTDGSEYDAFGYRPFDYKAAQGALEPAGIKLVGAGLGGAPSLAAVQAGALRSGGAFRRALTAESLPAIFGSLMNPILGEESIMEIEGILSEGVEESHEFFIDPDTSNISASIIIADGGGVTIRMTDPNGTTFDIDYAANQPDADYSSSGSHQHLSIDDPASGLWTGFFGIEGVPIARNDQVLQHGDMLNAKENDAEENDGGSRYFLSISARSNLSAKIVTAKDPYYRGESIELAVILTDSAPILGATVTGTAAYSAVIDETPSETHDLMFSDQDDDGIYVATIPGAEARAGTYLIDVTASGNSNGEAPVSFERRLQGMASVTSEELRITSVDLANDNRTITLNWNVPLTDATVETSQDLTNWKILESNIAGNSFSITADAPSDRAFYRIKVELPEPPDE